jgi:hypothetical protein
MKTHAKVVEITPVWVTQKARPVLRLELPNGFRIDCPDLDAKPGDIVAVLTEDEFKRIKELRRQVAKVKGES